MTGDAECSMFACHESMVAIWHDTAADVDYALCGAHAMKVAQLLDAQDRAATR